MIVIVDYEIGNVKSIINALKSKNQNYKLSRNSDEIMNADGIILPGVGAFSHAMNNLKKFGLIKIIKNYVSTGKPLLGICLGMQILLEQSEEFGINKGLGLVEGTVIKLPVKNDMSIKLPHISWNKILKDKISWNKTILDGIKENSEVYFVHTYVAVPKHKNQILSITNYFDVDFCSSIKKNNVYGCQFHPEKSSTVGLQIINNFLKICNREI